MDQRPRPLRIADLLGKVVLLDFWTYGCINCMHVIPDLKRLEAKYPDELVVVGVHSAKFRHEGDFGSVRRIVERYELEHPVVNDPGFVLWRAYGVRAWPTLVAIDPEGSVVGKFSGEGVYEPFDRVVGGLIAEFGARPGGLDRRPLDVMMAARQTAAAPGAGAAAAGPGAGSPATGLAFPGKVLVDTAGGRLFIADSNHHRIVIADLASGAVLGVVGGPESGFGDGIYEAARFARPQGMALGAGGDVLYVADTENHALRAVELEHGRVSTVAGTGRQAQTYPPQAGFAWETELNSPWDLEMVGGRLFVAMAGSHQLWLFDLSSGRLVPWAGSGREGLDDGRSGRGDPGAAERRDVGRDVVVLRRPRGECRPHGVARPAGRGRHHRRHRSVRLRRSRRGGRRGAAAAPARPRLPAVGRAALRRRHLQQQGQDRRSHDASRDHAPRRPGRVPRRARAALRRTRGSGRGRPGRLRGRHQQPRRAAGRPGGGITTTFTLSDPGGILAAAADRPSEVVHLAPQALATGDVSLVVDVRLPPGSHVDEQGTFVVHVVDGPLTFPGGRGTRRVVAPQFPLELAAVVAAGAATVRVDLTMYVCGDRLQGLCRSRQVRLVVPTRDEHGDRGRQRRSLRPSSRR